MPHVCASLVVPATVNPEPVRPAKSCEPYFRDLKLCCLISTNTSW